jgi:cyanophycinase
VADQPGALALFGGVAWAHDGGIAAELIKSADSDVVVLPTAAAYEGPAAAVTRLADELVSTGASVRPLMVLTRRDAGMTEHADVLRQARLICLVGGSPLHLMSVMKDSLVFTALISAWRSGATIIGAEGGASVLSDPMIDPRGGALTVGLGLVRDMSVYTGYRGALDASLERTLALATLNCPVVAIGKDGGVVREPDGIWRSEGSVTVFEGVEVSGLAALAGKPLG